MSSELPPYHPDQPEEDIPGYTTLPPLEPEDEPVKDEIIPPSVPSSSSSELILPPLVLGCATFGYNIYATPDSVRSTLPLRTVRLALSSGITAFDTAPRYHPSEIILGNCLRALKDEWPREKYQFITKVGKYGPEKEMHSFEAGAVRKCVERSLRRLGTDYLDVVYLHDIEFRSTITCPPGNPLLALSPEHASTYGLTESQLKPLGEGDEEILSAIAELRLLQSEGKIKYVGIAAYPLPILLRFSLLVLKTTGKPIDIVQTYAHQTLANHTLSEGFLEAFEKAQVGVVTNASPLGMGLLTKSGGPEWHPARQTDLFEVTMDAVKMCEEEGVAVEDVATGFGYREIRLRAGEGGVVPVVVGCKNLEEVHANLKSFARAKKGDQDAQGKKEREVGERIIGLMEERKVRNWSWSSP